MSLDGPYQAQREAEYESIVDGIFEHVETQEMDILESLIEEAIDNGLANVQTEYEYDKDDFRLNVLLALDPIIKKEIARLIMR
jgi:hypothetical protein